MSAFVYLMTNRRNGILYTGVTTNMPRRAYEHREGLVAGFTKKYGLKLRRVILIAIRLLLRHTYGNRMSKIDHLFVVGGGFLAVRRIADDQ